MMVGSDNLILESFHLHFLYRFILLLKFQFLFSFQIISVPISDKFFLHHFGFTFENVTK